MKFKLVCSTTGEDITLNINADTEEDAEAIALVNYNINEVKTIVPVTKQKNSNITYDSMKRREYPYIKNTGKSTVRIFT